MRRFVAWKMAVMVSATNAGRRLVIRVWMHNPPRCAAFQTRKSTSAPMRAELPQACEQMTLTRGGEQLRRREPNHDPSDCYRRLQADPPALLRHLESVSRSHHTLHGHLRCP